MKDELIRKVREFAVAKHDEVGSMYGDEPYEIHLSDVADVCEEFKHLAHDDYVICKAGCWGHDLIEETGLSYNKIMGMFGRDVAEVIFSVTDGDGRNRKERALNTYMKLMYNSNGKFVKLCDRIANARMSKATRPDKYSMYVKEYPAFKYFLYKRGEFEEMWCALDMLLST